KNELGCENIEALEKGLPNLFKHVENMQQVFEIPTVVAINKFPTDTDREWDFVIEKCQQLGIKVVLSEVWAKGGKGAIELAEAVVELAQSEPYVNFSYDLQLPIEEKLKTLVQRVYGGDGIKVTLKAKKNIE